jgi:small ligand-binding sensory domain FIST
MPGENTTPPADSARNVLALVSLLASLIFPLNVALTALGVVAMDNHLIPEKAMSIVLAVGGVVGTLGFPAMLTAIATGHVALVIAKRYSRRAARRWMAIVGLIVAYLCLLAFGSVIALFLIAGLNGF